MNGKRKPAHTILLTHEEKVAWFMDKINERERTIGFDSEQSLLQFLRVIRRSFKDVYDRDVPGYFIRKIASNCGLNIEVSPKTRVKMNFAFSLMDDNVNYRENKSELTRALEKEFGEKTLNYIVDDIFEEWHDRKSHPSPTANVDIHGQESLFD